MNAGTIDVDQARVESGSIAYGLGGGSLSLRNSVIKGAGRIYANSYAGSVLIEKNVFVRCHAIAIWHDLPTTHTITIRNNVFVAPARTNDKSDAAIEIAATRPGASPLIEKNTFYTTTALAVSAWPRSKTLADFASASVTNNFWSTTDEAVIRQMIYDKSTDLDSQGTLSYKPFLTAPDPATPSPGPWLD